MTTMFSKEAIDEITATAKSERKKLRRALRMTYGQHGEMVRKRFVAAALASWSDEGDEEEDLVIRRGVRQGKR